MYLASIPGIQAIATDNCDPNVTLAQSLNVVTNAGVHNITVNATDIYGNRGN